MSSPAFTSEQSAWTLAALVALGTFSCWYLRKSAVAATPPSGTTNGAVARAKGSELLKEVLVRPEDLKGEVRVAKLLVHPIKSCRGTSVTEARYTPAGIEGDRRWCIVDAKTHKVLTARELPKMVLITPELLPDVLRVSFPIESGCESFEVPTFPSADVLATWERVGDVALWSWSDVDAYLLPPSSPPSGTLTAYLGRPVQLALKGPRERTCTPTHAAPALGSAAWPAQVEFQDGFPLLVASMESVRAVQAHIRTTVGKQGVAERWREEELVIERFRPNLVFEGAGVPYAEDAFAEIVILPASADPADPSVPAIAVVSKCTRCLLPNVDPTTGVRDAAVPFKPLMQTRRGLSPEVPSGACFGCNAVPRGVGIVRVGDVVHVRKWVRL